MRKKKILLINPRIMDAPAHPLGLLYIAASLEKAGFEVKVVDSEFIDEIVNEYTKFNPHIVGITSTTPQINKAFKIAKTLWNISGVPIIFGGVHTTAVPKEVLKKEFVDCVVIGEGERTFVELCRTKDISKINGIGYKVGNKMKFTKPRKLIAKLDNIPFPARHLLPSRWYFAPPRIRGIWTKSTATVMATRGCPYNCIYCSSHLIFGRKVRYRSVKNVIEELKGLREKFKIDSVWFSDDTFTVNHEWVKEFCRKLKNQKWKNFKWACQARVNTVNYELLKTMKNAGCIQIDFGVESGSMKVLKILKKEITPSQIVKTFDNIRSLGINSCATFILGTPGEMVEDLQCTERCVRRIKSGYTDFFFATPFPGTELYNNVSKFNLFKREELYNKCIATKHTDKPFMAINLSKEELVKWRTKLCNLVFFRNYYNYIKDPRFILGGISIIFRGRKGIFKGFGRFFRTRKIDSIFVEILKEYRRKTKNELQFL